MKHYYCVQSQTGEPPTWIIPAGTIEIKNNNLYIRGMVLMDGCYRIFTGDSYVDDYFIPKDPLETISVISYLMTNVGRRFYTEDELNKIFEQDKKIKKNFQSRENELGKDYDIFNPKSLLYVERKRY